MPGALASVCVIWLNVPTLVPSSTYSVGEVEKPPVANARSVRPSLLKSAARRVVKTMNVGKEKKMKISTVSPLILLLDIPSYFLIFPLISMFPGR